MLMGKLTRCFLIQLLALVIGGHASVAQTGKQEVRGVRAQNAEVIARSLGMAVDAYLEAREQQTGEILGAVLCGAVLRTGGYPEDAKSVMNAARAVKTERRATCNGLVGQRSTTAGSIRVDSVALEFHAAGGPTVRVFATIRYGGDSYPETARLQAVGYATSARWKLVEILR